MHNVIQVEQILRCMLQKEMHMYTTVVFNCYCSKNKFQGINFSRGAGREEGYGWMSMLFCGLLTSSNQNLLRILTLILKILIQVDD